MAALLVRDDAPRIVLLTFPPPCWRTAMTTRQFLFQHRPFAPAALYDAGFAHCRLRWTTRVLFTRFPTICCSTLSTSPPTLTSSHEGAYIGFCRYRWGTPRRFSYAGAFGLISHLLFSSGHDLLHHVATFHAGPFMLLYAVIYFSRAVIMAFHVFFPSQEQNGFYSRLRLVSSTIPLGLFCWRRRSKDVRYD